MIHRDCATWDDIVNMGMKGQVSGPGMKDPHHADSPTDEPGIGSQFQESLRRSLEQEIIEEFLIRTGEISEFVG
jgi:hypothetical protein